MHPYFVNDDVRGYGQAHGIRTEAWSPIAQGQVLEDSVVTDIAAVHGKSPAQTVLRWHIQRGDIVFPKSVATSRIRENYELFDFALNADQMASISALDRGASGRRGPDPDVFDWIPDR